MVSVSVNYFKMIPMVCIMGIIFCLSHQPGDTLELPDYPQIDKIAHMVIFGFLAVSAIFAFSSNYKKTYPFRVAIYATLFCVFYGITDEIHQIFVPNRFSSISDIVADGIGGLVISIFWYRMYIKKKGNSVSKEINV